MDFSKATSLLKQRKIDRRRAIQGGAAGIAAAGLTAAGLNAASAQGDTPESTDPGHKVEYLFVQSFQGGTLEATNEAEGEYTITLDHGLGQTIYFSDRPDRIVGAVPTWGFLDSFDFDKSVPPNAAIVFEAEEGVDIAVVELWNPAYDQASSTATYDLKVLENFNNFGMEFHGTAADLASVATHFGAAHLLIDGCLDKATYCQHQDANGEPVDTDGQRDLGDQTTCAHTGQWPYVYCDPCPLDLAELLQRCYDEFPDFCNDATPCALNWDGRHIPDNM